MSKAAEKEILIISFTDDNVVLQNTRGQRFSEKEGALAVKLNNNEAPVILDISRLVVYSASRLSHDLERTKALIQKYKCIDEIKVYNYSINFGDLTTVITHLKDLHQLHRYEFGPTSNYPEDAFSEVATILNDQKQLTGDQIDVSLYYGN